MGSDEILLVLGRSNRAGELMVDARQADQPHEPHLRKP